MKNAKRLMTLKPDRLLTHPRNMRRFYPADQVREMANSIAANKGVLEPLIVTGNGGGKWLVVDGNMRLAGARLLGDKCPLLDCKAVEQTEADQLLAMVTANSIRYDVDPVSEALHYQALRDEGLSVRQISKRTGVYEARINNRIILARLETPVQKLITDGKLPADHRVARALLKLTPAVRRKLAEKASQNPNMKIPTIINACERLAKDAKPAKKLKRPATALSGAQGRAEGPTPAKDLRKAVKQACGSCNQLEERLDKDGAPAWSVVAHAADAVCSGCELRDMQKICGSCPVVELLRNLVAAKEVRRGGD